MLLHRIVFVVVVVVCVGCQNINWRGQSNDEEAMQFKYKNDTTKYINQVTGVWGLNNAKVETIALVTQLPGTGSDPRPSGQRSKVIKDMQAHHITNPTEILASKETDIVAIAGLLPPGIRKGERFDVLVTKIQESEATSLRGGFVMQTTMRPLAVLENRVRQGHDAAVVKGRILVKGLFDTGSDGSLETTGYILGGGVALEDRPLGLAIRDEAGSLKLALSIARAINTRFSTFDRTGKVGVAEPKNDRAINLLVPDEYKHNIGRYVQVIMNMAYQENAEQRLNRMERLEHELNDAALAQTAALRLEAIGRDAIPALKRSLRHEDAEVRFHAAQALTYLDQPDGIQELKRAAINDPDFRWHALTALASSEHLEAGVVLTDLYHVESAETRYGAFHAMLARSPHDPTVAADPASNEFLLHLVPTTGPSLIHFARQNLPEIVVFGGGEPIEEKFLYVKNGLTIQVGKKSTIEITQYLPGRGEKRLECPNSTARLIQTLTKMGLDYGAILEICKESKQSGTLNSRIVINALPSPQRMYTRDLEESGEEITSSGRNQRLPTLFGDDADLAGQAAPGIDVAEPEQKKTGVFGKMKSWFSR